MNKQAAMTKKIKKIVFFKLLRLWSGLVSCDFLTHPKTPQIPQMAQSPVAWLVSFIDHRTMISDKSRWKERSILITKGRWINPLGKQKRKRGALTDLGLGDGVDVVDDDDRPGGHDHGDLLDALQRLQKLLDQGNLRRAANPQHVEVALLTPPPLRRHLSSLSLSLCVPLPSLSLSTNLKKQEQEQEWEGHSSKSNLGVPTNLSLVGFRFR